MIAKRALYCALLASVLSGCGGGGEPSPSTEGQGAGGLTKSDFTDPLYPHQWHLANSGQSNFSSEGGTSGIDLNIGNLFMHGSTGQGVKVMVLDDGIDIRHPDLAANVDSRRLFNFDTRAVDPDDPTPTNPEDAHGTAVAGIIAAVAENGIGGRGVAPEARLGGANFLDCGPRCEAGDPKMTIEAFGGAPFSADSWVFNGSFGIAPPVPIEGDIDVEKAPIAGLANLRGGKGALLIKSAGNDFESFSVGGEDPKQCGPANQHGLSCQNPSFDLTNTMPQVVVIGAVNARGVKSSYSTAGAAVMVAGLGGEYGRAEPSSAAEAGPAIMTTDLSGCAMGYSRAGLEDSKYGNDFNRPGTSINTQLNPQCDYVSTMNGTSASAPTVTGVVALMLQANPQLTWRDIRRILVRTSRRVDAAQAPVTLALADGGYVAEPGWVRNGAGRWFSNWYGYGLVDATAAVDAARATSTHLSGVMASSGWMTDKPASALPIPVASAVGLTRAVAVDAMTVEAVQLRLAIGGDARLGDLGIELISPSGTRSVLMTAHNAFQATTVASQLTLASSAFYDEPAHGTWTLRIVDVNGRGDAGTQALLEHWSLRIYGH